jgi:chemosensory pili system protein ChpC
MADEQQEVYSLMIPTVRTNILLPNSGVAEIVPFSNMGLFSEQESEKTPDWFLGHLLWRGHEVPLISIDVIRGERDPQANKRSRVAVVHTLNSNRDIPYLAIVVQGIPRLSHVTAEKMELIETDSLSDAEKMHIKVDDVEATIPDLDKLEEMVLAVMSEAEVD